MVMDEKMLKYIKESHTPWTPKRLALSPWETGLMSNLAVSRVVMGIERQVNRSMVDKNDTK